MTRPMNILRTRPGRNAFVRGLPTVTSCLPKCARLGSNPSASTASSHGISRGSTDKDSIEISMQSDTIIQTSVKAPVQFPSILWWTSRL